MRMKEKGRKERHKDGNKRQVIGKTSPKKKTRRENGSVQLNLKETWKEKKHTEGDGLKSKR
jgi:hypothetical protein